MDAPPTESPPKGSKAPWIRRVLLSFVVLLALTLGVVTLFGKWYFRPVRASDGHVGFLFLVAKDVYSTPSDAPAYAVNMSTKFPFLSMSSFSLGWRDRLNAAEFGSRSEVEGTTITLRVIGLTEYCSIARGRLRLIRLESADGKLAPNIYWAPNITMGPGAVSRTAEEWEQSVLSRNDAEVLEALVWLGGYHAPPDAKPVPGFYHEDLDQARLAYAVQMRPTVAKRILELGQSPNAWVREAAKAAEQPHTTPLRGP